MTESPQVGPPAAPSYGWPQPFVPRPAAPTGLAAATVVLSVVYTIGTVAGAVAAWPAADEDVSTTLTAYDAISVALLPLLVAVYVVGCLWLQAARRNTPPDVHERSGVWVWLGWWVPIVALWFPYQVVRDVRDASGGAQRVSLGLWWASWLVFQFTSNFAGRMSGEPGFADALKYFELASGVAAVIACALWCRVVLAITDGQEELLLAQR